MKVFVPGATGLIGGAVVRSLVAAGHEVTGLTSRANNTAAIERMGAKAVVGDMRDAVAYRAAAGSAEAIVHAAQAMPDKTRYTAADVEGYMGADADAADALVSVISPACRAFVFSSGAYVYGETGTQPVDETHSTEHHHAVMTRKLATEAKLLELARNGTVPVMIVRPGLVYGPGSFWGKLYLDAMKRGRRAMQLGNGRNILSFVHVDDAAEAYRTLLDHPAPGEIYNIADDEPAMLRDVVRAQAAAFGAPKPFALPGWLVRLAAGPLSGPPTLANNVLSNRKLRALGWTPKYPTYREGVVAIARAVTASA